MKNMLVKAKKLKLCACLSILFLLVNILCIFPGNNVRSDVVFPTAEEEINAITVGWNLGNTLDSYGTWISGNAPSSYETAWGNPVTTQALIQSVKDQGFNAIRIPVTWAQHIDENGNVDPAWMNRVREVVDYAYNLDMYVILNVHHDTGEHGSDKVCWIIADEGTYASTQERYANLWTNIANEFIDYDYHLMFEGYNEMLDMNNTWNAPSTGDGAYNAVNMYAQLFVDTVRATGGNNASRNLIVNTYVGSFDPQVLNHFEVPQDSADNHLAVQVHVYSPWGFTGTHAAVTWTSVHSSFEDSDKSEIDGVMAAIQSFSAGIGLPVIIGECGAEYKENDAAIAEYFSYLINSASSHGVRCFIWDNGQYGTGSSEGGYALVERNSLTWKQIIVDAIFARDNEMPAEETVIVTEETEPSEETIIMEETAASEETVPSEEPATSEETAPSEEAVLSETTATSAETAAAETAAVTEASTADKSDDSSESQGISYKPIIIAGVCTIVLIYVGLFILGRTKRQR